MKKLKSLCLIIASAVLLFGTATSYALPAAPAYNADFPDPYVLSDGGRYYAYSTGSNVMNLRAMTSTDLVNWSNPVDPLPQQPRWASRGATWAPSVIKIGSIYTMYYTTHSVSQNRQCISVATSNQPLGPYADNSWSPLVCQSSLGGSIDPNVYKAPNGNLYLFWKSDGSAIGQVSSLWGRQLSSNGRSFVGYFSSPTKLLTANASWQNRNIESPSVVFSGSSYYMFYSANLYDNPSYGIGYATSASVLGSYANQSPTQAWLGNTGTLVGPGMGNVFTDLSGAMRMSYHSWMNGVGYPNGAYRAMWIGSLGFVNGVPQLQ